MAANHGRALRTQAAGQGGTGEAGRHFGIGGGFTQFEGAIQVVDCESSAVIHACNVKKGSFQSAAEAFAKHFKDDYLGKPR